MNKGKFFLFLSPILIIGFTRLVAQWLQPLESNWVWVPFVLIYWLLILVLVKIYAPRLTLREILVKPEGKWYWSVLAVLVGISGVSYFLESLDYYRIPEYVAAGVVLSVINPFFEETYWRKLMVDGFQNKAAMAVYNSILFGLLHWFSFSVISAPNKDFLIFPITAVAGLIWSLVYYKLRSLRFVILSHFFMDIFGFSALFIR